MGEEITFDEAIELLNKIKNLKDKQVYLEECCGSIVLHAGYDFKHDEFIHRN